MNLFQSINQKLLKKNIPHKTKIKIKYHKKVHQKLNGQIEIKSGYYKIFKFKNILIKFNFVFLKN